jgi:hypothetical protein
MEVGNENPEPPVSREQAPQGRIDPSGAFFFAGMES